MSSYEKIISINKDFIDTTWKKIEEKLCLVAERNKGKLPYTTENGRYNDFSETMPDAWTNGFWPGMMWLLYVGSGKELYREVAEGAEKLLEVAAGDFDLLHHDVGFMWRISSGVNYRLTGNKKAKTRTMYMAASLASRYNMMTKSIRAWIEEERSRLVIIDCMMNLPLLYWASEETNDPRFSFIAQSHADTAMKNHIRSDGSVAHVLEYDLQTGELLGGAPGQGTGLDSSWTRGQAWALYGFILSYIHTGKEEYLETAKKVAHYFIACVSEFNYVAPYDFRQPDDFEGIDTSASAIAACGLIEIAKVVPDCEQSLYLRPAIKMLKALCEEHCNWSAEEDSILQNVASSAKKMNRPYIFGEYYFVEAFYKLKGFEPLFW